MKSIKEKQMLVKWAKALNEEIDSTILREVEEYDRIQEELKQSLKQKPVIKTKLSKEPLPILKEEKLEDIKQSVISKTDLISRSVEQISKDALREESFQQPDPSLVGPDIKEIRKKIKFLEQWISKVSMAGPGGGEVRLKFLDDVDRATIAENRHLAYNATTDTFFFEDVVSSGEVFGDDYTTEISSGNVISVINLPQGTPIGPIEQLSFNVLHTHEEVRVPGTLCWDPSDATLNLTHDNDVVQQIGQESYMLVRNKTGNTILNGEVIRFAGAEMNGTARMLGTQFLADGTYPSLYLVGIATSNIAANTDGFVTVTGKVRDLNTTGNTVGETWYSGNILYANPTIPGALTRIKPTAPNNVVPMAAILRVHETEGEIFVRPTIEQEQVYGRFSVTSDVTIPTINTANVLYYDTVDISRGVVRLANNHSQLQVKESGLFQIDLNFQIDATGGGFSSGTMFTWVIINGQDRPNSTRRQGVLGSAPSQNLGYSVVLSLNYNDIVQIGYAGDSTALRFDAAAATAFCPSTAAAKLGITQIQL